MVYQGMRGVTIGVNAMTKKKVSTRSRGASTRFLATKYASLLRFIPAP